VKRKKPKFRVGQVVAAKLGEVLERVLRYDGVFYLLSNSSLHWRENELRPLTKREKGE